MRRARYVVAFFMSFLLIVQPFGTAFAETLVQQSEEEASVEAEEAAENTETSEGSTEGETENSSEGVASEEVTTENTSGDGAVTDDDSTAEEQTDEESETEDEQEEEEETLTTQGGPGSSSSSVTWTGATTITSATTTTDQTYASTTASQNALLVNTSDDVTLTNPTVTKSGGTSAGDDESFYGINSAIMCKGGGTTTITGANITTDAAGANGVFSFGGNASTNATSGDGTTVVISDSTITTTGNGSGGIMTTGQGITQASNLTVTTSGGSSAAIRSDRGGGTVTVDGGTYETSGTGSPAVYATATIDVSNATLTSTNSQGIVNEGGNTVTLTNCEVNANNATLNGQDNFKNGVFLYQSMSGDATDGASVFTMTGGTLNNTAGHVFHVTNTSAAITLEGVTINNEDSEGVLISVCDDGWSGLDNEATINAVDQTLEGNLLVGDGDTLDLNLSGTSTWTGTTSGSIASHKDSSTISSSLGEVNLTLSDPATIVLTADTTVNSLSGSGYIDYNGYTLTVGSTSYTSGNIGEVVEKSDETATTYTVTVNEATNGTVEASASTAAEGDSITLTATPADGYELSKLTVVDASNNAVSVSNNAFTMPASNVTVTATFSAKEASTADYSAHLTFSDSAITETDAGSGYSISGTTLTISSAGTYRLSGSCSEGAVIASASDVVVELDGLTLSSSSTAPIVVKKTCTNVHIHLEDGTTSTITNNEDPTNEDSTDATVADAFEGACIKAKTDSSVTFCGGGNLKCVANTKNAIKGGTNATLTFNTTGTVTVSGNYSGSATSAGAVNNGIASDGALVFNAGTFDIDAANDGIKAVPDSDDTTSAGDITINGGTFSIDVDGDGIQAEHNLTINAGSFDIKTMQGYTTTSFDEDTMSCKGLKASGDREDIENIITINGGDFNINTIDDAVHSDMYAIINAGSFDIYTGDDGMHADTTLTLGTDGGLERDPDVNIASSYEGLEGGTVYIYSGRHYVVASDDGVNAAGGSSSGTDAGQPGGDGFNPGGGGPGNRQSLSAQATTSDYNIYIYGGELYVNCDGDGLDSNGGLYLLGGRQAVFSQGGNGDNSAIDADGTISISGATILTTGLAGMDGSAQSSWFGSGQKYKGASSSYNANTVLNAKAGSTIVMSYKLPKKVSYVMASWPSSVSSAAPTFASASSLTSCKSSSWAHSWNSGSTSDGITTYTCSSCGATEQQTTATGATVADCDHSVEADDTTVTEYTATFQVVDGDGAASSNATINTYYTQDYDEADETNVTTAIARDSSTGEADVSGSGQINFTVVPAEGYSVDDVSVEGSYKNLKGPSDTGVANTYRITKVAGDLTVTVTVSACAHENVGEPTWTWSDDYTTATAAFECSDCGNTVEVDGTVTSKLTDASTITFTATAELGGKTYTDTKTAAPFTGTFSIVGTDGKTSSNATINSYYTQDYTSASETNVTTAVARDGDTGNPVRSGGQINFAVVPADGYTVQGVAATSGTYKNIKGPADTAAANTYRLTKVSADTAITVTIAPKSSSTYSVTVDDATNGTVTANVSEAAEGDEVTITATPDDGYELESITVTDASGAGVTVKDSAFTMPASDVIVAATFLKKVAVPTGASLTYTTYQQTGVASGEGYTLSGTYKATNAGTYTATAKLADGYVWEDGTTGSQEISWSIAKVSVTAPTAKTGLSYNGEVQVGVATGSFYTLSGTYQAANAGSYTATATLKDTTNYQWSDKTTAAKSYNWSIAKVSVTAPTAVTGLTYNGSAQQGVATGSNYTLSGTYEATNAGTYTAKASLTNTTNYQWEDDTTVAKTVNWTIAQLAITDSNVTVGSIATQAWTGSAVTPTITVKYGSTTLTKGTDYTISYANNKNPGTATATIAGIGNFNGTRSLTFKIAKPTVGYRGHVQNVGWQGWKYDGTMAGTTGKSLRMEAINLKLSGMPVTGGITYRAHVQNVGWQGWKSDGALAGTTGRSLRLEAIQIKLTGNMAANYDVYYRAHCQDYGWMGWAKNGAYAGTAGYSKRLEAIQIVLVPKGGSAPGASYGGCKQATSVCYRSR